MASQARNLTTDQLATVNAIRDEIKKVDAIVDHMPADASQQVLSGYVDDIITIAKEIARLAKAGDIA
jgi:hypothetical protein